MLGSKTNEHTNSTRHCGLSPQNYTKSNNIRITALERSEKKILVRVGGGEVNMFYQGPRFKACKQIENGVTRKGFETYSPIKITLKGPRQANLVFIAYASSEGSGEPAHPHSLAGTFAARSYKQ